MTASRTNACSGHGRTGRRRNPRAMPSRIDATVAIDGDGKVAGLHFLPTSAGAQ